jgi:hypothetical protein
VRTWDENKQAINQLWPMAQFTEEERRLWHDDLSGLDQGVLYDAIRNVKRNTESLYPQLKSMRDEYRHLNRLVQYVNRPTASGEKREIVNIDKEEDKRFRDELRILIESAQPSDFWPTIDVVANKAAEKKIEMATAYGLVRYAIERLGMDDKSGGRIQHDAITGPVLGGAT